MPLKAGTIPDKSCEGLWKPVEWFWNPVSDRTSLVQWLWKPTISQDKFGEILEKEFWMVKHLDLSPNFFEVSLLIVQFFYDSNKI
jgi:hypothetical protein